MQQRLERIRLARRGRLALTWFAVSAGCGFQPSLLPDAPSLDWAHPHPDGTSLIWQKADAENPDNGTWRRREITLDPDETPVAWTRAGLITAGPHLRIRDPRWGTIRDSVTNAELVALSPDRDEALVSDGNRLRRLSLPQLTDLPISDAVASQVNYARDIDEDGHIRIRVPRGTDFFVAPQAVEVPQECTPDWTTSPCRPHPGPAYRSPAETRTSSTGNRAVFTHGDLAIYAGDGTLVHHRVRSGYSVRTRSFWSPDGDVLMVWRRRTAERFELTAPFTWTPAGDRTHAIQWNASRSHAITYHRDYALLWDIEGGRSLDLPFEESHFRGNQRVTVTADDHRIDLDLATGARRTLPIWDAAAIYWLEPDALVILNEGGVQSRVSATDGTLLGIADPTPPPSPTGVPTDRLPPGTVVNHTTPMKRGTALRSWGRGQSELLTGVVPPRPPAKRRTILSHFGYGPRSTPWNADGSATVKHRGTQVSLWSTYPQQETHWTAPSRVSESATDRTGERVIALLQSGGGLVYARERSNPICTFRHISHAVPLLSPSGDRFLVLGLQTAKMYDTATCTVLWEDAPASGRPISKMRTVYESRSFRMLEASLYSGAVVSASPHSHAYVPVPTDASRPKRVYTYGIHGPPTLGE